MFRMVIYTFEENVSLKAVVSSTWNKVVLMTADTECCQHFWTYCNEYIIQSEFNLIAMWSDKNREKSI